MLAVVNGRNQSQISISSLKILLKSYGSMLDEIVSALQNFNFQLPLYPSNLTREIETIKKQMEAALNTTFAVETEEVQINKKLSKVTLESKFVIDKKVNWHR